MNTLPSSESAPKGVDVAKIKKMIVRRNLTGLANSTKWNELIDSVRARTDWQPSYRSKSVEGYVSGWDVEWCYHLPFPFVGVEWFDISLQSTQQRQDTSWIVNLVEGIGFEFEAREGMLRIWGYGPKSYDDFGV
tara:strand:- start:1368 stop:1769 length:402 start_codon:yes stop_codon:yes gene_type:complete